jgi:N-acetylneuraminic acid mutarotase
MIYDPVADRWTSLAPVPQPHTSAIAVLDGKGQPVIVHGACDNDHDKQFGAYRYDVDRATWTAGTPVRETFGATVSLGDGRTLVVGGLDFGTLESIATAQILDASASTWRPVASAPTPRSHGTAIRAADAKVIVLGGVTTVDVYEPANDTWTQNVPLPVATWNMPAVVLRDGRVLVTAGFDSNTETFGDESWLYDSMTGSPSG